MGKLWERVKMAFSEFTSNKDMTVQAEQIEEPRNIITTNGPVYAGEGEWEVRSPDGNVQKYSDEAFQEEFMGGAGEQTTLYEGDSSESSTKESGSEDTTGDDSGQDSSDTPTKDSDRDSPEGDGSETDTSAESGTTDTEKDTSKSKSTDPLL